MCSDPLIADVQELADDLFEGPWAVTRVRCDICGAWAFNVHPEAMEWPCECHVCRHFSMYPEEPD